VNPLYPCPSCQRHVRRQAAQCPFCSSELSPEAVRPLLPSARRLGRFASFTVQSGLVVTALGCSESTLVPSDSGPAAGGAASGGAASGGAASGGTLGSGGDPGLGGGGMGGTAGTGGTGSDIGTGGDDPGVPIYSAVPWTDPERP